jgi:hypothetical protein
MVVVREAANIIEYCQGEHFVSLPKDGSHGHLKPKSYPRQPRGGLAKKPAPRVENAAAQTITASSKQR